MLENEKLTQGDLTGHLPPIRHMTHDTEHYMSRVRVCSTALVPLETNLSGSAVPCKPLSPFSPGRNSSLSGTFFFNTGNDSSARCFTNESIGSFEMDGKYWPMILVKLKFLCFFCRWKISELIQIFAVKFFFGFLCAQLTSFFLRW